MGRVGSELGERVSVGLWNREADKESRSVRVRDARVNIILYVSLQLYHQDI